MSSCTYKQKAQTKSKHFKCLAAWKLLNKPFNGETRATQCERAHLSFLLAFTQRKTYGIATSKARASPRLRALTHTFAKVYLTAVLGTQT